MRIPSGRGCRRGGQTDRAESSEGQQGITPGRPLNRKEGSEGLKALFVTEAEARVDLAMDHFELPSLPSPSQQGAKGQGQDPVVVLPAGIDQLEIGVGLFGFAVTGVTAHDDEKQGQGGHPAPQEGAFDAVDSRA